MSDLSLVPLWYVCFLFSTVLHEAAHAWIGARCGDSTARSQGLASADPFVHIRRSPVGMIVMPLISLFMFGWPMGFASVPFDPVWALEHPRSAAEMSLAGPAANIALAVVAGVLLRAGLVAGWFASPDYVVIGRVAVGALGAGSDLAATLLGMMLSLNVILAIFNLLPVPPLDGSGGIALLMRPETATRYRAFLMDHAGLGWVLLLVVWQVAGPVLRGAFLAVVNLVNPTSFYS